MNVALRRPMSIEEFLDWESRQELRHEFDGFRALAMTGGTAAHASIQANLLAALVPRLRGKQCRAYGSELKLRLAGTVRYPDALVMCVPVARDAVFVTEPSVVFEILSASSTHQDLVVKNSEYRTAPSIQRYVVLEQTHVAALMFARLGEEWVSTTVSGADGVLSLPEIAIEISLAELYADIDLGNYE